MAEHNPTSPKVGIPAIAGGIILIVMWLGGYFLPDLFEALPAGAESTLTMMVMTALGYMVRDPMRPAPAAPKQ